jgi:hypothetical protein
MYINGDINTYLTIVACSFLNTRTPNFGGSIYFNAYEASKIIIIASNFTNTSAS